MIKLVGILIVVAGFALRVHPLLVVVTAGFATGLAAGRSFHDVLTQFGTLFIENRYMLLPFLSIPAIGLLERHGLQERVQTLVRRIDTASAGRVILFYTLVRQIAAGLGLNLGGHVAAVRPLIAPMAEAAAQKQHGELTEKSSEQIRAHAAAAENVGNFFGEDIFIAIGAILLMKAFFNNLQMDVSVWALALWAVPTAVAAFIAMAWRARSLDRSLVSQAREPSRRE